MKYNLVGMCGGGSMAKFRQHVYGIYQQIVTNEITVVYAEECDNDEIQYRKEVQREFQ